MPQNQPNPSRMWEEDVAFFRREFENSPEGVEYRDIFKKRYEEDLRELTELEIDRAKYNNELTPSSDLREFRNSAARKLARAEKKGDTSAARRASIESEKVIGPGLENPLVLEAPAANRKTLNSEQWRQICHDRMGGYRSGVGNEKTQLEGEIVEARMTHSSDPRQEAIAEKLKQQLGPRPQERQPMWELQDRMEFGVDKTLGGTFDPDEDKIR